MIPLLRASTTLRSLAERSGPMRLRAFWSSCSRISSSCRRSLLTRGTASRPSHHSRNRRDSSRSSPSASAAISRRASWLRATTSCRSSTSKDSTPANWLTSELMFRGTPISISIRLDLRLRCSSREAVITGSSAAVLVNTREQVLRQWSRSVSGRHCTGSSGKSAARASARATVRLSSTKPRQPFD